MKRKSSDSRSLVVKRGARAHRNHRSPPPPVVRIKAIRPPSVGVLRTSEDILRETLKIYRLVRKGELDERTGTRLIFMLNSSAQQAKPLEEKRELQLLRAQLQAAGVLGPEGYQLPALEHDPAGDDQGDRS